MAEWLVELNGQPADLDELVGQFLSAQLNVYSVLHNYARGSFFILPSCENWGLLCVNKLRTFSRIRL
jgi:hypothetical protein